MTCNIDFDTLFLATEEKINTTGVGAISKGHPPPAPTFPPKLPLVECYYDKIFFYGSQ